MDSFGLRFHHLGLACRDENRAVGFLQDLKYEIGKRVYDPLQGVTLLMCTSDSMPDVEIVVPVDTPGPLDRILSGSDALTYHICYSSHDISASIEALRSANHRLVCVSESKPAVLFGGRPVSFYIVRGFGLIELLEAE